MATCPRCTNGRIRVFVDGKEVDSGVCPVCKGTGVIESFTSFVLADADWHYIINHNEIDTDDLEFRYGTLEEARNNLEHASEVTDIPVSEMIILKETREEVQ